MQVEVRTSSRWTAGSTNTLIPGYARHAPHILSFLFNVWKWKSCHRNNKAWSWKRWRLSQNVQRQYCHGMLTAQPVLCKHSWSPPCDLRRRKASSFQNKATHKPHICCHFLRIINYFPCWNFHWLHHRFWKAIIHTIIQKVFIQCLFHDQQDE